MNNNMYDEYNKDNTYMNSNNINNNNSLYTNSNNMNNSVYANSNNKNKKEKNPLKIVTTVLGVFIFLFLVGFGLVYTGVIKINYVAPKSILLSRGNVALKSGREYQLDYQLYPETTSEKNVYFESSDPSVMEVNEVTGYVTAKKEGEAYVVIKSKNDNSVVDSTKVVVADTLVPAEQIVLSSEKLVFDLSNVSSKLLKVSIEPENASNKKFDFYSGDDSIAVVDENGYVTPVGFGRTKINVTTKDGSLKASCEVVVTDSKNKQVYFEDVDNKKIVYPYAIELETNYLRLKPETSRKVGFTLLPPDVTEDVVSWISADSKIATVKDGVVEGKTIGTTTITAITVNDLVAKLTVEVTNEESEITILEAREPDVVLDNGERKKINLRYNADATNNLFTYKSEDESIATVSSEGEVKAVGVGMTKIIVTSDNGLSTEVIIRVNSAPDDTNPVIDNDVITLNSGSTLELPTTNSNGEEVNAVYKTTDGSVLEVDSETGLISGELNGDTSVIVETSDGVQTYYPVSVEKVDVTKIEITNYDKEIKVGQKEELEYVVYPVDATNKSITFKSSNETVATVSEIGEVNAIGVGSADITITSVDNPNVYRTITINVTKQNTDNQEIKDQTTENKFEETDKTAVVEIFKEVLNEKQLSARENIIEFVQEINDKLNKGGYYLDLKISYKNNENTEKKYDYSTINDDVLKQLEDDKTGILKLKLVEFYQADSTEACLLLDETAIDNLFEKLNDSSNSSGTNSNKNSSSKNTKKVAEIKTQLDVFTISTDAPYYLLSSSIRVRFEGEEEFVSCKDNFSEYLKVETYDQNYFDIENGKIIINKRPAKDTKLFVKVSTLDGTVYKVCTILLKGETKAIKEIRNFDSLTINSSANNNLKVYVKYDGYSNYTYINPSEYSKLFNFVSSNPNILYVDSDGNLTVKKVPAKDTNVTIKVGLKNDFTVSPKSCTVTIKAGVIEKIKTQNDRTSISKAGSNISIKNLFQIKFKGYDDYKSYSDLSDYVSFSPINDNFTVSSDGVVTIKNDLTKKTDLKINIRGKNNNTVLATITLSFDLSNVKYKKIIISGTADEYAVGDSGKIKVNLLTEDDRIISSANSSVKLTYKSSQSDYVSIDNEGNFNVKKNGTTSEKKVLLIVETTDSNVIQKYATINIKIKPDKEKYKSIKISINKTEYSNVGDSDYIMVRLVKQDGSLENVPPTSFDYSCTSEEYVSVDKSGKVKIVKNNSKKDIYSTITVKLKSSSTYEVSNDTATLTIKVKKAEKNEEKEYTCYKYRKFSGYSCNRKDYYLLNSYCYKVVSYNVYNNMSEDEKNKYKSQSINGNKLTPKLYYNVHLSRTKDNALKNYSDVFYLTDTYSTANDSKNKFIGKFKCSKSCNTNGNNCEYLGKTQ